MYEKTIQKEKNQFLKGAPEICTSPTPTTKRGKQRIVSPGDNPNNNAYNVISVIQLHNKNENLVDEHYNGQAYLPNESIESKLSGRSKGTQNESNTVMTERDTDDYQLKKPFLTQSPHNPWSRANQHNLHHTKKLQSAV